jgi:outer membrane protein OmpA-like peptidoglycan-associated protein
MKRNLLFLFVFATLSVGAFAQRTVSHERVLRDGTIRTDVFTPQTFITAGFGGLVYWGEHDSHRSLIHRISPALDLGIGRYFSPKVGARLMYGGLRASGTTIYGLSQFSESRPWMPGEIWYQEKFNVNYVHADFLWNLSNTLGGFRADRPWEFVPYAGIGWAFASKKGVKSSNSFAPTVGLINKIRISPRMDMNLDTRFVFVKEAFDGVIGAKSGLEYFTTATFGFSYYFHRREVAVPIERVDLSPYENRIGTLERDLAAARATADQLERDLLAAQNRPAPRPTVTTELVAAPLAIFFPIDRATLNDKEKINLGFIAETIKKTPNKTYTIFGSADRQTGSPVYNQGLSERRAQAVMDELVKLGVNRSQLRLNPVGDTQQRFGDNHPILNRVVVIENQ